MGYSGCSGLDEGKLLVSNTSESYLKIWLPHQLQTLLFNTFVLQYSDISK